MEIRCLLQASLPMNATNCCESLNVNPSCIDACSAGAFLDLDSVLDQPECVNDLPKIVKCAAGKAKKYTYALLIPIVTKNL